MLTVCPSCQKPFEANEALEAGPGLPLCDDCSQATEAPPPPGKAQPQRRPTSLGLGAPRKPEIPKMASKTAPPPADEGGPSSKPAIAKPIATKVEPRVAKVEPAKVEPVSKIEPARVAQVEPAKAQPVAKPKVEPAKAEPVAKPKVEPAKAE